MEYILLRSRKIRKYTTARDEESELTNCFFLSDSSLVISFFPASSACSSYTNSRTKNLKNEITK